MIMGGEPLNLIGFSGLARLFPLPDFVLFPHVVAPLHIFEPRYHQMTADALAGDRLIAMVLLKPGYEEDYAGAPPIHDMACLGQIVNEQRLPDGKFNLLVRGLSRLRLEKEVPTDRLYRLAQGWPLPDADGDPLSDLREALSDATSPLLPDQGPAAGQLKSLFSSKLPLGGLCDVLAFALPLPTDVRQILLEELDIEQRTRRLIHELQSGAVPEIVPRRPEGWKFPPDFSVN
jgi:Lon protease-like protein